MSVLLCHAARERVWTESPHHCLHAKRHSTIIYTSHGCVSTVAGGNGVARTEQDVEKDLLGVGALQEQGLA